MGIESSQALLESLSAALPKLKFGLDPIEDAAAIFEIERMIAVRMTELEFLIAVRDATCQRYGIPNPLSSPELMSVGLGIGL
jgi:hypothetical protein